MISCWNEDPKDRPKFCDLVVVLSCMLEVEAGYIQFEESMKECLSQTQVDVEKKKREVREHGHDETVF